jgi:hypothetical protein
MSKNRTALLPVELIETVRIKYPFEKSLTIAFRKLNEELKYGINEANKKVFNVKKR